MTAVFFTRVSMSYQHPKLPRLISVRECFVSYGVEYWRPRMIDAQDIVCVSRCKNGGVTLRVLGRLWGTNDIEVTATTLGRISKMAEEVGVGLLPVPNKIGVIYNPAHCKLAPALAQRNGNIIAPPCLVPQR